VSRWRFALPDLSLHAAKSSHSAAALNRLQGCPDDVLPSIALIVDLGVQALGLPLRRHRHSYRSTLAQARFLADFRRDHAPIRRLFSHDAQSNRRPRRSVALPVPNPAQSPDRLAPYAGVGALTGTKIASNNSAVMNPARPPHQHRITAASRQARAAWRLQYRDSRQSLMQAEQACARALATGDLAAEGWARLTRGVHLLRYGPRNDSHAELTRAQECFDVVADEAGSILTRAWIARAILLDGRPAEALDMLLPLREAGLRLLKEEERGMLLNNIAGCHSTVGESAQAFAYMYQAMRETSAARNRGFDLVLYNNIGHELCELGDSAEALRYLDQGLERCQQVANPHMMAIMLTNRIACMIDLGRPGEALADIERLLAMPADATGRGRGSARFETMAIAALRAGRIELGADLVARADYAREEMGTDDERIELAVATAELLRTRGDLAGAAAALEAVIPLVSRSDAAGPRTRCLLYRALADIHEQSGDVAESLRHMRTWQRLFEERVQRASQARFQAASLQTELLRLRHERDEIDARRRTSERAKQNLETMNRQLSQKVKEVEALQAALREQAVRDFLTGLFNRRYLNEVLPAMLALAERADEPLALAIIDFDHFKTINDMHGHAAGDALLAEFGRLLKTRLRKSDVACRYGGEEFCVLMPHTDAEAAQRKLASLQEAWREKVFAFDSGAVSRCTFSAGIADSLLVRGSVDALLRAADTAELEAKRRGRDRIVLSDWEGAERRFEGDSYMGTVAGG
jgi:diguanylate cyclase (GGDEF)-like protein